jgi:Zn-dependent M28 family amino/carboxypeptidase
MLGLVALRAVLLASLCLAPTCAPSPAGQSPELAFDAQRAYRHLVAQVELGPRPAGSPGAEETRAYIERELAAHGIETRRESFTADTPLGPIAMANVVAELPCAAGEEAPIVLLATHYETKRAPFEFVGANDAASGTAVLLELARVLASRQNPVRYRLVFLDGEEALRWSWEDPDNRYGSRHHAAELERSGLASRVEACVLLDLVGDRDLRLTTDANSDERLREAFFGAARRAGLGRHVDGVREPVKDDHLSFMAVGIKSVDLIDLEYGPNNSWWHTAQDTLDKVSAESLGVIGRIVLLGLPAVEELVR